MLNGRVYGGPKRDPNANPFANARDEDPEFVEWGYGGMGSVRGGKHAGVVGAEADKDKERTRWERLQSDGLVVGSFAEGEKEGVGGVAGAEEGDDGSGMGWVRKRREAKEKAKREKEMAEAAATATATEAVPPPPSDTAPTPEAIELAPEPEPTHLPVPPTLARLPSATPSDPEHILKTVTLPAHLHHHHSHRRTQSRTASSEIVAGSGSAGELPLTSPGHGVKGVTSPLTSPGVTAPQEGGSESESESESEMESEDEEGAVVRQEEEDDEDEDEDEAAQEEARKTALGAGVEKISRHN
jgi:hypothetical protein